MRKIFYIIISIIVVGLLVLIAQIQDREEVNQGEFMEKPTKTVEQEFDNNPNAKM